MMCAWDLLSPHCRGELCGVESLVLSFLAGLPVTLGSNKKTTKKCFMFCVRDDLDYVKEFLYRH